MNGKFRSDRARVFFADEYICTISAPDRAIDETQLKGESWLDMRDRTQRKRDSSRKEAVRLAGVVSAALSADAA